MKYNIMIYHVDGTIHATEIAYSMVDALKIVNEWIYLGYNVLIK